MFFLKPGFPKKTHIKVSFKAIDGKKTCQEWPHSWENFIPDLCGSCKTNQLLCENNLRILNMLSHLAG